MRLIRTTIGVWILLFFLFLPFPYTVLPNFGEALSESLFPLVQFIASIIGIELKEVNFHSDSVHLYVQLLTLLILSLGISFGLSKIKSIRPEKLQTVLNTAVAYTLAFFLIKYGNDKLFKHQFYDAEPNTLFTPTGYLSKDLLFWTSMGSSHSYNVFMGIIEIVPAILLFWRKTRMLGALIALGVLTNVLALNFGFDITVKILSTMLVFASLYVLTPHFKKLWSFFVRQEQVEPILHVEIIEKPVLKRALKGFVVALLIIESSLIYLTANEWNGDNQPKIPHYGSFNIELFSGSCPAFDISNTKRIHIHSKGYLIIETKDGNFKDHKVFISPSENKITFAGTSVEMDVKWGKYTTTFTSNNPQHNYEIITRKIDIEKLPLRSDSFHWTVDSFAEE